MTDYETIAREIGMDEQEAQLWEACCRAEEHYRALREAGANQRLIDRAHCAWNEAAWRYASYGRS